MEVDGRASARAGEACTSEFGRWAALVDHLDLLCGRAPGGPTQYLSAEKDWAEEHLFGCRPVTTADWRWVANWRKRAFQNSWTVEAAAAFMAVG
jgi:hypothetical protein